MTEELLYRCSVYAANKRTTKVATLREPLEKELPRL